MATDACIGGVALHQINQLHFDRALLDEWCRRCILVDS